MDDGYDLTDDKEVEASSYLWELIASGGYTKKQLVKVMGDRGYYEPLTLLVLHSYDGVHWELRKIKHRRANNSEYWVSVYVLKD